MSIENRNSNKQNKSEREINLVGNFLLTLYHGLKIGPQNDWSCLDSDIQKEFEKGVEPIMRERLLEANKAGNIGDILKNNGFLKTTSDCSEYYKIKSEALLQFRKTKLIEIDKRRIQNDANSFINIGSENNLENPRDMPKLSAFQVHYEIDENSPVESLQYQGTKEQERLSNYYGTNLACFICQLNFATMNAYEHHIQKHNDDSDFEYTNELEPYKAAVFVLSYRLCKNSHNFCFTIKTESSNLVIEKIIIIQSRSMVYVNDMSLPYDMPTNGCQNFYVDSHLFTMHIEHPIVILCHLKDNKNIQIVEEHHFMRTLEFPKVNFAIKPYRLPSSKLFKPTIKLKNFFAPLEIRDAFKADDINASLMQTSNEFSDYVKNATTMNLEKMGTIFSTLLHIEEMDIMRDYLRLVQYNVQLRNFGDNYSMRVSSKQRMYIENILSVFDEVIITTSKNVNNDFRSLLAIVLQTEEDMKNSKSLQVLGKIENINSGRISFKCYKKLDIHGTYTIVFRPSRLQICHQHRALEMMLREDVQKRLKNFLFPKELSAKSPSNISLELYNKTIYDNPEQLQAVRNIAQGPRKDATYIIFGPPGTGKTTALVESILQLLKRDNTKILITASSNSACDELALRLCKTLTTIDMSRAIVRIYARSTEQRLDSVDDLLLENSNMYSTHFYPDVEVLHEYRIVVCTMAVVARLSTGKFGQQNSGKTLYTHLFIDEVAASTEVESLMAMTSILTSKSCLIIAGDHKQLGPVIKSRRAENFNLGCSLMDRLLKRECYRVDAHTGDYDRSVQSRLRLNFRSHPAIVNLYSGMYYNHELEAKANIDNVSLVKHWHLAPNKEYPIIFHSINGKSSSDNQSFSLYNSDEIKVVMDYVKDLMYFGINGKTIKETDIGIISPYKRQYIRLREELNLRKWYQIETGSVETFQGKEKEIIIASFVRSETATLGFLESPRRLNVTLSRAKSLLILVGNAKTLSANSDFAHVIQECERHQTLIGYQEMETPLSSSSSDLNIDRNELVINKCNADDNSPKKKRSRGRGRGRKRKISNKLGQDKENRLQTDKACVIPIRPQTIQNKTQISLTLKKIAAIKQILKSQCKNQNKGSATQPNSTKLKTEYTLKLETKEIPQQSSVSSGLKKNRNELVMKQCNIGDNVAKVKRKRKRGSRSSKTKTSNKLGQGKENIPQTEKAGITPIPMQAKENKISPTLKKNPDVKQVIKSQCGVQKKGPSTELTTQQHNNKKGAENSSKKKEMKTLRRKYFQIMQQQKNQAKNVANKLVTQKVQSIPFAQFKRMQLNKSKTKIKDNNMKATEAIKSSKKENTQQTDNVKKKDVIPNSSTSNEKNLSNTFTNKSSLK